MNYIGLITKRELKAFFASPLAYIIIALVLAVDSIFFYAYALKRLEYTLKVIQTLFWVFSGTTMTASCFISMGLLAGEKDSQTMELLYTSPVKDYQIVLGKWIASVLFFSVILLLSFYLPLFVFIYGEISFGQILTGYLGSLLLASTSLSIGIFTSSLTKNQLIAVVLSGAIIITLLVVGWLGNYVDNKELAAVLPKLSLFENFKNFEKGIIYLRDVVFHVSVSVFFLYLTIKMVESRRWK